MATAAQRTAYIAQVADAIGGMSLGGLLPSVLIAQACLESGYGQSALAATYHNHFGLKVGSGTNYGGWNGQRITLKTGEVVNGQKVTVSGTFKCFGSLQQCIIERNGLLSSTNRYRPCLKETTPRGQIMAICNGGYATAENYVPAIMEIIESNNLERFDPHPSPDERVPSASVNKKTYKMSTKTLSIIVLAAGAALAALGAYNLFM